MRGKLAKCRFESDVTIAPSMRPAHYAREVAGASPNTRPNPSLQ